MKTRWAIFASVCFFGLTGCAEGFSFLDSISVGAGVSRHNEIAIYRLGLRKDSEYKFLQNPTGWLSGYYEASAGFWYEGDDKIYTGAFSPVFVYYFGAPDMKIQPYIEAGIGVAGISETHLGPRNFSTGFQFEDRIGAGVKIDSVDISIRYMHYSNGSITQPNDGIDIFIATVGYCF
jgi:lipid A 3-O-deacylase